jgi:hypothetical protein
LGARRGGVGLLVVAVREPKERWGGGSWDGKNCGWRDEEVEKRGEGARKMGKGELWRRRQ